jgi:hypothetical protein
MTPVWAIKPIVPKGPNLTERHFKPYEETQVAALMTLSGEGASKSTYGRSTQGSLLSPWAQKSPD